MRSHVLPLMFLASLLTAGGAAAQDAPPPPSPCKVAVDRQYGYEPAHPVQVGGSPMYGAARQRRYLDLLRGPQGQPITYERSGAQFAADRKTMIDRYVIRYEGLEAPIAIYLDWYRFTEPMAPAGLGCAAPLELGVPPPDPFQAVEQLEALAAATAEAGGSPVAPIPLGATGSAGFVLDRFRVAARPRPRGAMVPDAHRTIVVLNAATCGDRRVSPAAVTLGRGAQSATPIETFTAATRFAALATGLTVPDGSLGAVFQVDGVGDGVEVRATFDGPGCAGEPAERTWPLQVTGAQLVDAPMAARPADDTSRATFVAVQAIVDHAGAFRQARALGGPDVLVRAALDAVAAWRARPATANGVPLVAPVVLMVRFSDAAAPREVPAPR